MHMNGKYVDFSSGRMLRGLGRQWRVIVVCALLGLALAGGRVLMQGTSYSAQSQVLVGQPMTLQSLTTTTPANVDQTRLVDYTQRVLAGDNIANTVEKELEVDGDDYTLDVLSANATSVIALRVTADDPERARDIANAFARTYVAWVAANNTGKVDRAVQHLRKDIKAVAKDLLRLDQQVANAANPGTTATVLSPQRTVLVQQQVALENRLSQAQLAGAVDPSGGGQVVDKASAGQVSKLAAGGPLVLGLLFGLLVGLGIAAIRTRPAPGGDDASDVSLSVAPERASA